jgi:benzoylformate decarboxylase
MAQNNGAIRFKLIEQFCADGIHYMFGNPGTVEEGFLDAISAFPEFKYIETLQEGVAVGAADGYARVTHKPALVQLHSGVGLANGISLLYQAKRGHSPLVVIAGEAGLAYDAFDAQNNANLVDIARPVVKYAARVVHQGSVLRTVRRAIKMAATPPMGPTFVSLPLDILDLPAIEPVVPTSLPETRTRPDSTAIERAATILLTGNYPMLIVGDGIAFSDAEDALLCVARQLGAKVYGADYSEANFPSDDPLYGGLLSHMWGSADIPISSKADVILVVGTYLFPEVFPSLDPYFAPGARIICIDLDAYEMGKNFPFELGLLADPQLTLKALCESIEKMATAQYRTAAAERREKARVAFEASRADLLRQDGAVRDSMPLQMSRFAEELAPHIAKEDTVVVDEAITNSQALTRYLLPKRKGSYFLTRGGSLGIGLPGAVGAKLAKPKPEQIVIGFAGDGGAMYTFQALWTAAHHQLGCKFIVCNNRSYRILKLNIDQYWKERAIPQHDYPASFDIKDPDIRFDLMAKSMGVDAVRVAEPSQIAPAIAQMLDPANRNKPFLIDLVLAG